MPALPVPMVTPGQSSPGRGTDLTHPSRMGRAAVLSWVVGFSCWACLQAYLLPWLSYLSYVPGAQSKGKVVVILLSNGVSPVFSKCPSGQGLFPTKACSSHDTNGELNTCVALPRHAGQHAPIQRVPCPLPWLILPYFCLNLCNDYSNGFAFQLIWRSQPYLLVSLEIWWHFSSAWRHFH